MNSKIYNGNVQPNPKEFKIWVNDEGTIRTWNGTKWVESTASEGSSGSGESDELMRFGYCILSIYDGEQFVHIELNKMKIVQYLGNDNKPILEKINYEYDNTNNVYVLLKSDWNKGMNFLVEVTNLYGMEGGVMNVLLEQNDFPINADSATDSMCGFTFSWDVTSGVILSFKYDPSTDMEAIDAAILLFDDPTAPE